jgi:hypothetical protein
MKDYILLNKDRLLRTFGWTSVFLTIAFSAWRYYKCNGNFFYSSEFTIGIVWTLLILPTCSIIFSTIDGYIKYWRTSKFFESTPIADLLRNGFRKDWSDRDSKWWLSTLILVGPFDRYEMICELDRGRLRVIAKSNYDHLDAWDNKEINLVLQSFKNVRFEYDGQGIATSLKMSDVKKMTYEGLVNYLKDFVEMLKKLKVE